MVIIFKAKEHICIFFLNGAVFNSNYKIRQLSQSHTIVKPKPNQLLTKLDNSPNLKTLPNCSQKQNQSNCLITSDTQLKTALHFSTYLLHKPDIIHRPFQHHKVQRSVNKSTQNCHGLYTCTMHSKHQY